MSTAPENCKQIFDELPNRFDGGAAAGWNTTIQFNIAGDKGGDFVVKVEDGKCETSEGTADGPSATLTTDDETWIGIVSGSVNPMTAFTLGKLKVQGNMGDVMKMQNMLKS